MTATGAPTSNLASSGSLGFRKLKNYVATVLVTASFGVALIPLIWLLVTVISKGWHVIVNASWWTGTQHTRATGDLNFSDKGGGAFHAIVGTLEQVALCTLVSVPIAVLVGIYLVEYGTGRLARTATFMVDIMTGIPSVVAALFVFALAISTFHMQKSGWLVSAALVILMVPVIVRTTEEMLKLVPNELREASYALGIVKWKTIIKVVLPTAFTGLITGVVLGVARVAGETAPLLILGPYAKSTNWNPFSGNQAALPTMINDMFLNIGNKTGTGSYHLDANGNRVAGAAANFAPDRMWGAALTLIILVLALNLFARFIGRFNKLGN